MKTIFKFNSGDYDNEDWNDFGHEEIMSVLQAEIDKTHIKTAFLTIKNGGWKKQNGITPIFKLTAENLYNKICGSTDTSFKIMKEGHKLSFVRHTHDEPTGATISLHASKWYEREHKKIF